MKIETLAGDHIEKVIHRASEVARKQDRVVWFDFNAEMIYVAPQDEPAALLDAWDERMEARRREHRASKAYLEAEMDNLKGIQAAQIAINRLITELDAALAGGLPALLDWLSEFTSHADVTGVLIPHHRIAAKLAAVAPANTNVGRSDLSVRGNELEVARWLIGQAVAYLERGTPPHPIIGFKAAELRASLKVSK